MKYNKDDIGYFSLSNSKLHCICCGEKLESLDICKNSVNKFEHESDIVHDMIDGAVCGKISANFGSIYDSVVFAIGICDKCIKEKLKTKQLVYLYNYME